MIHLVMIALFQNLILNNSNFTSLNSTSGLLQGINAGLQSQSPFPNPLGSAIVIMVFIIVMAVSSFKVDLPIGAAVGSLIATGTALLLQTPGLALVGSTIVYIFAGLTVMFIFIALSAGGKNPFGGR